jgi:hypothetical protein
MFKIKYINACLFPFLETAREVPSMTQPKLIGSRQHAYSMHLSSEVSGKHLSGVELKEVVQLNPCILFEITATARAEKS